MTSLGSHSWSVAEPGPTAGPPDAKGYTVSKKRKAVLGGLFFFFFFFNKPVKKFYEKIIYFCSCLCFGFSQNLCFVPLTLIVSPTNKKSRKSNN